VSEWVKFYVCLTHLGHLRDDYSRQSLVLVLTTTKIIPKITQTNTKKAWLQQ